MGQTCSYTNYYRSYKQKTAIYVKKVCKILTERIQPGSNNRGQKHINKRHQYKYLCAYIMISETSPFNSF